MDHDPVSWEMSGWWRSWRNQGCASAFFHTCVFTHNIMETAPSIFPATLALRCMWCWTWKGPEGFYMAGKARFFWSSMTDSLWHFWSNLQIVSWSLLIYVYQYQCTQFSSVQSLSRVRLFVTPWIAAHQASLSITNSWSLPKLMSIELVMPSSHLILCRPLLLLPQSLPASESFPMSQLFAWGGQSIGVSALASFLPKKSQDWSPLEWTGWISLVPMIY